MQNHVNDMLSYEHGDKTSRLQKRRKSQISIEKDISEGLATIS